MRKHETTERPTVAVVGCAGAGAFWVRHLHGDDVDVVLFDEMPGQARKIARAHGGQAVDTFAELLARRPAGVVIATPSWHRPAVEALRQRASLLLATPVALDLDSVRGLVAEAGSLQRTVTIASPQLVMAHDLIGQHPVARIKAIRITWRRRIGVEDPLGVLGVHAFGIVRALRNRAPIRRVRTEVSEDRHLVLLDGGCEWGAMSIVVEFEQRAVMTAEEEVTLALDGTYSALRAPLRTRETAAADRCDYQPELVELACDKPRTVRLAEVPSVDAASRRDAKRWLGMLGGRQASDGMSYWLEGDDAVQALALLDAARRSEASGGSAREVVA